MGGKREKGDFFAVSTDNAYFSHANSFQEVPIQNLEREIAKFILNNGVPKGSDHFQTISGVEVMTLFDIDYTPDSTATQSASLQITLPSYEEMVKIWKNAGLYQYEQIPNTDLLGSKLSKFHFLAMGDSEAKKVLAKNYNDCTISKINNMLARGMILDRIDLDENDKIIKIAVT
jgi:hypothetical protein